MNEGRFHQYLLDGVLAAAGQALLEPTKLQAGFSGGHPGYRPGNSMDFLDHREYQPGDDLRRIDWGAYARTDRLTIKQYHQEVTPHLDIVIDGTRSMALQASPKLQALLGLSGFLATAAENGGYAHDVWLVGGGSRKTLNGNRAPMEWEPFQFEEQGSPYDGLLYLAPQMRKRGVRVLISDLFWEGDPHKVLARFARDSAAVLVVQLLTGLDLDITQHGNANLLDTETGERLEIFIDEGVRRRYRDALAGLQRQWRHAARRTGAMITSIVAEPFLKEWRFESEVAGRLLRA